jgi:ATP-binding cassette subfamily C protein
MTNLHHFLQNQNILETPLTELRARCSGGQCQRLAPARILLTHNSINTIEEATSDTDVESEEAIMALSESSRNQQPSSWCPIGSLTSSTAPIFL